MTKIYTKQQIECYESHPLREKFEDQLKLFLDDVLTYLMDEKIDVNIKARLNISLINRFRPDMLVSRIDIETVDHTIISKINKSLNSLTCIRNYIPNLLRAADLWSSKPLDCWLRDLTFPDLSEKINIRNEYWRKLLYADSEADEFALNKLTYLLPQWYDIYGNSYTDDLHYRMFYTDCAIMDVLNRHREELKDWWSILYYYPCKLLRNDRHPNTNKYPIKQFLGYKRRWIMDDYISHHMRNLIDSQQNDLFFDDLIVPQALKTKPIPMINYSLGPIQVIEDYIIQEDDSVRIERDFNNTYPKVWKP